MSSANLFWIHVQGVLQHHPGVSLRSIFGIYNYNFGMGPCDVPMLSCTVDSAVGFEDKLPTFGSLWLRGNPETVCALGFALAIAVKKGILDEWRDFLLEVPVMVHVSIGKSFNIMMRVNLSQFIMNQTGNCKMTALQEAASFNEFEKEFVANHGVQTTQTALAAHLEQTQPWAQSNTRWSKPRVVGCLWLLYTILVANPEALRLCNEIQLIWGADCMMNDLWVLNGFNVLTAPEVTFALRCLKVAFTRGIISEPTEISKITLKGRIDRGQVGEIKCCKVKFVHHSWATAIYSGVVRPHVADKCSDPIVLDKHCPCEKEMQHDNASDSFCRS